MSGRSDDTTKRPDIHETKSRNKKFGLHIKNTPKNLHTPNKKPNFALANPRKDAGAVDRDGLENRCTLTGTQGSNPCLSAN